MTDDTAPVGRPILLQVAALPIRFEDGQARVLLVTSRGTHRWLIPKGWPMKGKKNWEAAAQEAKEEAGVIGKPFKKPLGEYLYAKRRAGQSDLLCRVEVYAMNCDKLLDTFREKGQRELRWFDFADAVEIVEEPGLMALLRGVDLTPFQKPVKRKSSARAATEHRSATESKSSTKLKSSAKIKTSTKAKSPAKRKSTAKRKLPAGDKSIEKPNKKHVEKSAAF